MGASRAWEHPQKGTETLEISTPPAFSALCELIRHCSRLHIHGIVQAMIVSSLPFAI